MRTRSSRIASVRNQIPPPKGIEMAPPVRIRNPILQRIVVLCCTLATTAAFGQTIFNWTGGGDGISMSAAANWGGTLPSNGSIAQWDGLVGGNLALTYNGGIGGGFQQPGVNFVMTANQTGSVSISSPVAASANLAVFHVTNSTASAALTFGDGSANVLNIIWRATPADPPYDPHYLINLSSSPATIRPNVRWQAGGGNAHTLVFGGTGNWVITNNLTTANGVGTTIVKDGSGTLTWSGPSIGGALGNSTINSPVDFRSGTVVLRNSGLLGTQRITNNGAMFQFEAPSQSQTLSGPIHGAGLLKVSAGTLTLSSGASDFTGNIELNNTGTLIVGGGENPGVSGPLGIGGTILFTGGTLQFSVNNTFDYSPRFSTAAGQAYSFNSGGQNVTFATDLNSSGGTLTKSGSGTVTLTGTSSYSGLTTVSAGKLVFQGSKTGAGDITVANAAAVGVTATGTQVTPGVLTVGTSSGATLEFNNVNSTATAPLAAGTLSAGGTITININSGTFTMGQSYPLLTWTSGTAPTVALGTLTGAGGNLSVIGNTVFLNVTSIAYIWSGLNNGSWDTTTPNNWIVAGSPAVFVNGGTALFDDTAAGETNVTVSGTVTPGSVTVNSSAKIYSIASSPGNVIAGTGSLTKNGNSTLTLSGAANTYSGPTVVSGGTLSVADLANGGAPSDIGAASSSAANLVLNGGTLRYTGVGATADRLFTLGTGNGSIDASGAAALNLSNTGAAGLSGTGARVLTLTGNNVEDNTLAASIGDNGGATSVAKSGSGKWVLAGNNTYSGGTTVAGGTLQVGSGGASGSLGSGSVVANGAVIFNRTGTLTNAVISGTGALTVSGGGTVVLPGNNTYSGGTTIAIDSTLQVGTGGATGTLNSGSPVVVDGTIIFDSTSDFNIAGFGANITGAGNLIKRGSGLLKIIGNNSYSGWTVIESGARLQISEGNQGSFASSFVTNNGTLIMTRQDNATFIYGGSIHGTGVVVKENNNQNAGDVTLTGVNGYTGGTVIAGGGIVLGDGATPGSGTIAGDVIFTNSVTVFDNPRTLTFNRPDDFTFSGNILNAITGTPASNPGSVVHNGPGILTLTGNNTYAGGTTINGGTVQVGNGGATGAIGTGNVVNNALLVFNRTGDLTVGGIISGPGALVKTGSGTVVLAATNTYTGSTTVSNGTLVVSGGVVGGELTLEGGAIAAAPAGAVGALSVATGMNINSGSVLVTLNKSLASSNTTYTAGAAIIAAAGSVNVANAGPGLAVGDKFYLFNQPVVNGNLLTVTGGGATWANNLATDGSITVLTVTAPQPTTLNVTRSGGNLEFSWTGSGFKLQSQTNALSVGISNNWGDYPGGGSSPVTVPLNPANGAVFFRLIATP